MGFFSKFKKNNTEQAKNSLILSMPLFNSTEDYLWNKVANDLKSYWHLNVTSQTDDEDGSIVILKIETETVALAFMPAPVPHTDLDEIIGFNYLWKNAKEEIGQHTNHAIVSVMESDTDDVERFKILTKINASILRTAESAIGIYQGSQTLLLPKNLYLDFADFLLDDDMLPIQLWVYIGIINGEKNNIYTYGMKEFGKSEIEILDSPMDSDELYDFLIPVLNYILESDVTLKDGETIGFSKEQKINISKSKARYLDGDSLKFEL